MLSLRKLAWQIGVPIEQLRAIATAIRSDFRSQYREFTLRTGKDKIRVIRPPRDELMRVQRRITKRVLHPLGVTEHAHGGVPGRSPSSNAAAHRGQPCVVTVDVKSFFDNVDHRRVYRMFRDEYDCSHDVARLLTRLTTLRGSLPQGAPTSPALANLFMTVAVDTALGPTLRAHRLKYTRFVDDLVFSGSDPRPAINKVANLLSARGLSIKKSKVRITARNRPQEVTGLLVNDGERLTVPRRQRDRVRAAIYQLRSADVPRKELEAQVRSINGRIAHIERFHPGDGLRLRRYLESALLHRGRL